MQPASPAPANPRPLSKLVTYTYAALAGGYLLYSILTNTGLCGWLIALQIKLFGSASDNIGLA